MKKHASTSSETIRLVLLVVAVSVGSGMAHTGTTSMPFQVGALIDGTRRTASESGIFGFFEVAALSLGMVLISPWVDRVLPSRIAVAGCLLGLLGNIALYFVSAFSAQILAGTVVGVGYGLVFAATVAGVAGTRDPDRIYGIGNGGALLVIMLLMAVIPLAGARLGPLGIFVALATLCAFSIPFLFGLYPGKKSTSTDLSSLRTPGAAGLMFAWTVWAAGTGSLYVFSERIARGIQLSPTLITSVLSTGVLVGVLGAMVASILGRRISRAVALVGGMSGSGAACLLLGLCTNATMFAAGVYLYWIFYMFVYTYLLGSAALLDRSGRVGTLGAGLDRLGYAVGAALGGFLAEYITYSATAFVGFTGCLLGIVVGLPPFLRALRSHSPISEDGTEQLNGAKKLQI